jgi:hypothetical protein
MAKTPAEKKAEDEAFYIKLGPHPSFAERSSNEVPAGVKGQKE